MKSIITYTKEIPFFKKFFGIALVILAFLVIFNNLMFFFIFLFIGLNLVAADGSEIDLNSKTFRNIKSAFGIKFGKWQPCPDFEYISVFKTKEKQTINVVTASTTFTDHKIVVNLFYERNKHITFYKTDNKEDAFEVAKKIKNIFEIEIYDATDH
jgi:hypothetical protein